MKKKVAMLIAIPILASTLWAGVPSKKDASASATVTTSAVDNAAMRIEGEKRFRTNCSRCHAAPHKFPPRMMATIVRHMRVRATITDEDMRFVLYYMTQ